MEWLKDWWGVIVAFLVGAMWVGRLQKEVSDLTADEIRDPAITASRCAEIRKWCKTANDLQFASGAKEFTDIKILIAAVDKKSDDRHNEIMHMLINMHKEKE